MIRWFLGVWEVLVEPAQMEDARERQLSGLLNVILPGLLFWGIEAELTSKRPGKNQIFSARDRKDQ